MKCLGLVAAAFTFFPTASSVAQSATRVQPTATRALLLDAVINGHAIVAVGERGTVIRTVDSGETWEVAPTPTHATLTGISFANANPNIGWAVGHDGVILHTRDGGETWTEQFHAEDRETVFLDVATIDTTRAIAVGAFGACYTTRDGGRTWQSQKLSDHDAHLNRITLTPEGGIYIAGERGTLLFLPSFTKPAQLLTSPGQVSLYGVALIGQNTLLAYGVRGHLYESSNAGQSWERIDSPLPARFASALRLKSGTILIAGQARSFIASRDGGRTFRTWQTPLTTAVAEIVEAPNGMILAFGEAGVTRLDPPEPPPPTKPPVF